MKMLQKFALMFTSLMLVCPEFAKAEDVSTEERFQDVFITAGYATAFGAALGAACLSFFDNPQDRLQYVAVGASLGFIGGSVLGTYVVLSPVVSNTPLDGASLLADNQTSSSKSDLFIRPVIHQKSGELLQLEGAWTIARF